MISTTTAPRGSGARRRPTRSSSTPASTLGGSVTGEHGVGMDKASSLPCAVRPTPTSSSWRGFRRLLDPGRESTRTPGKVLPVAPRVRRGLPSRPRPLAPRRRLGVRAMCSSRRPRCCDALAGHRRRSSTRGAIPRRAGRRGRRRRGAAVGGSRRERPRGGAAFLVAGLGGAARRNSPRGSGSGDGRAIRRGASMWSWMSQGSPA